MVFGFGYLRIRVLLYLFLILLIVGFKLLGIKVVLVLYDGGCIFFFEFSLVKVFIE